MSFMGLIFLKNIKNLYFALPKQHQIIIMSCAAIVLILFMVPLENSKQVSSNNSGEFKIGERHQVAMPEQSNDAEVTNNIQLPVPPIEELKINQGPAPDLPSNIEEDAAQLSLSCHSAFLFG